MYCTPTRTASKCGPNVVVRAVFKVCVCVCGGGGGGGGGFASLASFSFPLTF